MASGVDKKRAKRKPKIITPDTTIDCEPHQCRLAARWCLTYQEQANAAKAQVDPKDVFERASIVPMGALKIVASRHACLACPGGRVIASALKKNHRASKEVEGMDVRKAKAAAREVVEEVRPTAPVQKHLACIACGAAPRVNPVTRMCSACHSKAMRATREQANATRAAKALGQREGWLREALERYKNIELYDQIAEIATRELRTPEAQAIWMLQDVVSSGRAR